MLPFQRLVSASSAGAPGRVSDGEASTPPTSSCATAGPEAAARPSAASAARVLVGAKVSCGSFNATSRCPSSEHAQRSPGVEPAVDGLGLPEIVGDRLVRFQLRRPVVLI